MLPASRSASSTTPTKGPSASSVAKTSPLSSTGRPSSVSSDGRPVRLSLQGTKKGAFLVAVEGISTREDAAALSRVRLYLPRADLPAPDDDEWYHADLIGLGARDTDGRPLGLVIAVPDFGAGPLLEIEQRTGSTVYVPFTQAFVPTVDVTGGYVAIDPPAGLFAPEPGENDNGEP